ncbi:hypothetical protein KIF24_18310 [Micromonospora sp. Llam7]|uniref:hypothetical protein n=1 Tax=Micromonospora tarapacensis TaxID=2835305 RepID=UPI001C832D7F|nr:hypothetical protein [Micromonospora tarapacensis]MBX7267796.1 hypothetical protein [Micromonospora tarapacensis]
MGVRGTAPVRPGGAEWRRERATARTTSGHPAAAVGRRRGDDAGHPAVDAAVQAIVNAAALAPADQIPQYEAAYQTLRETLATIDQD